MARSSIQFIQARNSKLQEILAISYMALAVVMFTTRSITMARTFNVLDFGAVGDGVTEDSNAFAATWNAACSDKSHRSKLIVPEGRTFLLYPVEFKGPCYSQLISFEISGTLIAPEKGSPAWKYNGPYLITKIWLSFREINGLILNGVGRRGLIDGNGRSWWKAADADVSNRPTALHFGACNNLRLQSLRHLNSQKNHISIYNCQDGTIADINIKARADSPNTDGIDISNSEYIHIEDSEIATGDDCIAINGGSSNIYIKGIACGPGHGISIGSLGRNRTRGDVEEVHVDDCSFKKTTNGLRIKTWQGGSGFARRIFYRRITFDRVKNPIIINQFYCDPCEGEDVKISGVEYHKIRGTTLTAAAIKLNCTVPCTNLLFQDVNLQPVDSSTRLSAVCRNAHGRAYNTNPPLDCLK